MKIAICEDEPLFQQKLKAGIERFFAEKKIETTFDCFLNGTELIHNLKKEYDEIEAIKELKSKINISFIVQHDARGLGDAVHHAKDFAKGDDFALILGDDFVFSNNQEIFWCPI